MTHRTSLAVILLFLLAPLAKAADLTGTVINQTTGQPAGDVDVILLKLGEGMEEAGRAKTDAQGRYRIALDDAKAPHLVRVVFQDVTYHKQAPPGATTADVDVYNSAERVQGVRTGMRFIKLEPQAGRLNVTEMFVVRNQSQPPRTQMGERAYVVQLPPAAVIDSSLIATGGGMPLGGSPIPQKRPGEYAFMFPVRPGETRFQVAYHLPYSGSMAWKPEAVGGLEHLLLLVPPGVQFTPADASLFQNMQDEPNAHVATNVQPSANLAFTISGTGSFPPEAAQGGGQQGGQQQPGGRELPGGGIGKPIDSPNPLSQQHMWWILGGFAVVLAAGAWFFYKQPALPQEPEVDPTKPVHATKRAAARPAAAAPAARATGNGRAGLLLDALKEELFALETERAAGKISAEEYRKHKDALDVTLQRALSRQK